ncbi:DUF6879 family protein [Nonomuraea endophytica]|uniref:DUF6879 domain-containing protein n=1 Tax=Nonomuraea endophytica TaxID=714136 RepID=A0A7W8A727_9ACTN|nr:DUF6879 family protein [Nonomuraea endophytica]MBB5079836.1 hypothetical protein [Nonomuraea endophytica]
MKPITYEQFKALFRSRRRAWHLELRDVYRVESEDIPFEKWLNGEHDSFEWLQDWLDHMRAVTGDGVSVERLRIVTEPHTDYVRWEMSFSHRNIEAGEQIRYLPRSEVVDMRFPPEDCWLFDDDTLVLSLFKPDGRSAGFAVEDDQSLIAQYQSVRDSTWSQGISHASYAVQ